MTIFCFRSLNIFIILLKSHLLILVLVYIFFSSVPTYFVLIYWSTFSCFIYLVFYIILIICFIYVFLTVLGLHCWVGFSVAAESRGHSSCGPWASHCSGFSGCGSRAQGYLGISSCGTWSQGLWFVNS